jgi:toxin ParE1/3/4
MVERSIADREKIGAFYKEEASLFVAIEADKSILTAAKKLKIDSLAYRIGHKAGTREYVMRRFPYILVYRVKGNTVEIIRVLHQAMRYFN